MATIVKNVEALLPDSRSKLDSNNKESFEMGNQRAKEIIAQFEPLIARYRELQVKSKYDDLSDLKEDSRILVGRMQAAFQRVVPASSTYALDAAKLRDEHSRVAVHGLVALAQGLVADINDGWGTTLIELVHAETYADMIEMSRGLLDSGYKDAAAVVIGTSLELHLRALATAHQLATQDTKGRNVKADALKADLRKAGTFSQIQEKQITYWLGVRNSAAHGSYGDYSRDDVSRMIDGITTLVDTHPA